MDSKKKVLRNEEKILSDEEKILSDEEKRMIKNGESHIRIELQTKKCGRKIFIIKPRKKENK